MVAYNPKYIKSLGGKRKLFHQADFEEETEGEHRKSSNTAKDISTIGHYLKRRMSAVKFGAT